MAATWFLVVVVAGLSMFHANAAEPEASKSAKNMVKPTPLKKAIDSVDSVDKRIIVRLKRLPKRSLIADDLQIIIRQAPINSRIALKSVEYMPDAQNLDQHNIHQRSLEASEPSETGMRTKKNGNKSR